MTTKMEGINSLQIKKRSRVVSEMDIEKDSSFIICYRSSQFYFFSTNYEIIILYLLGLKIRIVRN